MFRIKLVLICFSIIFFFVYLFLYIRPSVLSLPVAQTAAGDGPAFLILNQPDESVNYFFIRQLVLENRFNFPEPLSKESLNQVHPRSTTVIKGALAPIGFPGIIIIFGIILKALLLVIPAAYFNLLAVAITPLIAAITPFFFYGFLRRVFSQNVAWLSAALLFVLPPWWYYASRPFQHNTLFVFLIVAGLYGYVAAKYDTVNSAKQSCGQLDGIASPPQFHRGSSQCRGVGMALFLGVLFGMAIYVRPIEAVWLSALALVGLISLRRYWGWREYGAAFGGAVLMAVAFFATQTAFYGHPLASGYVKPLADGSAGIITAGPQGISLLKAMFLPFGFHLLAILRNFKAYFVDLFGVWMIVVFLGVVMWCRWYLKHDIANPPQEGEAIPSLSNAGLLRRFAPRNIIYVVFLFLVFCHLLIFYGSWIFYDNLLQIPSIGTSYVRYFLPIYVFSLPFAAGLIVWLWQRGRVWRGLAGAVVILMIIISAGEVFAPLEGLASVKKTVAQYGEWQARVYELTEPNAVIVTRYADKYIFPGRKIISGWELPEQARAIRNLLQADYPVYLYDLKDEKMSGFVLSKPIGAWADLELRKIKLTKGTL